MDTPVVIAIVIAVVVVLAAISFLTLARRSDVRGAGALSSETRRRDRDARKQSTRLAESPTRRPPPRPSRPARSPATARRSRRRPTGRPYPSSRPTRR